MTLSHHPGEGENGSSVNMMQTVSLFLSNPLGELSLILPEKHVSPNIGCTNVDLVPHSLSSKLCYGPLGGALVMPWPHLMNLPSHIAVPAGTLYVIAFFIIAMSVEINSLLPKI